MNPQVRRAPLSQQFERMPPLVRRYTFGMCDVMALALHRIVPGANGYALILSGNEPVHALIRVDGKVMDASGQKTEAEMLHYFQGQNLKIVDATEADVRFAFTVLEIDDQDIQTAMNDALELNLIPRGTLRERYFTALLKNHPDMSDAQREVCGSYRVIVSPDAAGSPCNDCAPPEILYRLISLSDDGWPEGAECIVKDSEGRVLEINEDQCPTDVGHITFYRQGEAK